MRIYREHGPPKMLGYDNGGEFKGNTKRPSSIGSWKV